MNSYLFFLGQTTELCLAELQAVLHRLSLPSATVIAPLVARVDTAESLDAVTLQDILGGTVKIAKLITTLSLEQQTDVQETVMNVLRERLPKRFVIAEHGRDHLPALSPEQFKHDLFKEGIKSSFKDTPRYGANAALLKSSRALEIHILQTKDSIFIATTEAFQDVDTWSLRDVGKPHRDVKRGMLQPKIARMMLNLAIGDNDPVKQVVVLDPFCGMGTVLIEATMLDVPTVLGSDLAPEAVNQSRSNLAWWQENLVEQFSSELIVSPVERLTLRDFQHQPTVVVTEPFLGKLTPREEDLPGIIRGLEKMYRGMLRAFGRLLPVGGRVAILFPAYRMGRRTVTVENTLKDITTMGFKLTEGPYRAGRPDAVTQRQVYVFEKADAVI